MADKTDGGEAPPKKRTKLEDETEADLIGNGATDPVSSSSVSACAEVGGENNQELCEAVGEEVNCNNIQENVLLAKVPPELWELIFSYLGGPQEVHNVMNACQNWHELMSSKITRIMFPLVLPHLIPYLPPPSVLGLRQICKHWKHSIDTALQNHSTSPQKFECHWWHTDSPYEPVFNYIERPYLLYTSLEIDELTKSLSSHPTTHNPFISRTITIKFDGGPDFLQNSERGITFLQKYGLHIWDFTHYSPLLGTSESLAVNQLPSVLTHLPNLKSLKIDWNSDEDARDIQAETLELLRTEKGKNFPDLPNLTSLNYDFRDGGDLELALGIALFQRYGNQLDTLVVQGEFLELGAITPELFRELLPNLKNLRVFCVTSGALQKLSLLQDFPLERLQLWYSFHSMQFKSILKAINSFSSTLIQLHMDVKLNYPLEGWGAVVNDLAAMVATDNDNATDEPEEMNRPFPNLRKLGAPVSSVNSPWFWQLVRIKFKSLETLELQTAMESLFAPFEKRYLEREIQESKGLFDCLPSLDKIRFWFHNQGSLVLRRDT